ncbi:MAG: winged helix-turn-helix domain-containing protein [Deltaproteobacteria bacterium]|nr:winged helix-turn-helix domain-containing protein [Deltaproteobacteria bacterium]
MEHTQYLRVYMGHLRRKIEPDEESTKLIVTEPGVGYRLLIKEEKK